jgi:hypothetical protein
VRWSGGLGKTIASPTKSLLYDFGVHTYPSWWHLASLPILGGCLLLVALYTKIITKSQFFEFKDVEGCSVELPRNPHHRTIANWYTVRCYDPLTSFYWALSWFVVVMLTLSAGMYFFGFLPKGEIHGIVNLAAASIFISTALFVLYFTLHIIFSDKFWRYMKGG